MKIPVPMHCRSTIERGLGGPMGIRGSTDLIVEDPLTNAHRAEAGFFKMSMGLIFDVFDDQQGC